MGLPARIGLCESLLFLIVWSSFSEARISNFSKGEIVKSEERMIGSRPPTCEKSCRSCGHCQAIEVPTNPANSSAAAVISSRIGDYDSNYKPISWKCKCGNTIFNP